MWKKGTRLVRKDLTDEYLKKILYKWYREKKKSRYEIAKVLKVDQVTISNLCKRFEIPMRSHSESRIRKSICSNMTLKERTDTVIKLYKQGKGLQEIGEILGVSYATVGNWMKKEGIKPRSNSEASKLKWTDPRNAYNTKTSRQKRRSSMLKKWEDKEYQKSIRKGRSTRPNRFEYKIGCFLEMQDYTYIGDYSLFIGRYNPDFIWVAKKKIIECFGNYFHQNKKEEEEKTNYYKKYGYDTLVIWELELSEDMEKVRERIKNFNIC